jgi:hypothetical protein
LQPLLLFLWRNSFLGFTAAASAARSGNTGLSARAAGAEVDLSSFRSLVFDREFRRFSGTDHGFENLIQVEQSWS